MPVTYVVRDPNPSPASVVVVRGDDDLATASISHEVEEALLEFGVRVIQPPILKRVRVEMRGLEARSAELLGQSEAAPHVGKMQAGQEAVLTEDYWALGETAAEYVFYVYREGERVRLVRRATEEVIASGRKPSQITWKEYVKEILKRAGLSGDSGKQ